MKVQLVVEKSNYKYNFQELVAEIIKDGLDVNVNLTAEEVDALFLLNL